MRRLVTILLITIAALSTPGMSRSAIATSESKPSSQAENVTEVYIRDADGTMKKLVFDKNFKLGNQSYDSGKKESLLQPIDKPSEEKVNSEKTIFADPLVQGSEESTKKEKNITQGSEGAQVDVIQRHLQINGFDPGKLDGSYGSQTAAAVKQFQRAKGLEVTGVVNEATWKALTTEPLNATTPQPENLTPSSTELSETKTPETTVETPSSFETLTKGMTGEKVKTLQSKLDKLGYNPGPQDGIFGNRTRKAVKEFQLAQGLNDDGVVNQTTWSAIVEP
ncbi:MAG: peptidoglycan-binding domain-containing protein [Microcoleaceae cyanobacterium]